MQLLLLAVATLSSAVVLLVAGPAQAGETQIHAVLAMKNEGECTTVLGFVVESGTDEDAVRKQAKLKAEKEHPQSRNFAHADNFKKGKHLGNHAVVISAPLGK